MGEATASLHAKYAKRARGDTLGKTGGTAGNSRPCQAIGTFYFRGPQKAYAFWGRISGVPKNLRFSVDASIQKPMLFVAGFTCIGETKLIEV